MSRIASAEPITDEYNVFLFGVKYKLPELRALVSAADCQTVMETNDIRIVTVDAPWAKMRAPSIPQEQDLRSRSDSGSKRFPPFHSFLRPRDGRSSRDIGMRF